MREPGRTAGPSAALGMTKGRAVTFVRNRPDRMDRKKQQVPPLRLAALGGCEFFDFFVVLVAGKPCRAFVG